MNNIIKKSGLKSLFERKGFRINDKNLEKVSSIIENQIELLAEKFARNARISGRKTIKSEDILQA